MKRILQHTLLTFVYLTNSRLVYACPVGSHWVRAHHRRAYTRTDGTHFSEANVRSHCSENTPGFAFWFPKLQDKNPASWPILSEHSKKWSEEERERVVEALGFLPSQLSKSDIKGIFRMGKSRFFPNPASGDRKGQIVLYDNAFESSKNLSQILAHEIAHHVFNGISTDDFDGYRFASGWIRSGTAEKPSFLLVRKDVANSDSTESVEEDFSNNVEMFLFNPSKLQTVSPGAFRWIQTHFGDNFKLRSGKN